MCFCHLVSLTRYSFWLLFSIKNNMESYFEVQIVFTIITNSVFVSLCSAKVKLSFLFSETYANIPRKRSRWWYVFGVHNNHSISYLWFFSIWLFSCPTWSNITVPGKITLLKQVSPSMRGQNLYYVSAYKHFFGIPHSIFKQTQWRWLSRQT